MPRRVTPRTSSKPSTASAGCRMIIRRLETLAEVRTLDGLLGEYIRFVTSDLERAHGVTFDPDQLLANTLGSLDKVIPPNGYTFIAEGDDGVRLGMFFLRPSGPDAMEIKRLYVPLAGRGRGVGKTLVQHAMTTAKDNGARWTAHREFVDLAYEKFALFPPSVPFNWPNRPCR